MKTIPYVVIPKATAVQFISELRTNSASRILRSVGSIYPSRSDKVERAIDSPAANLNTLILA